MNRIFEKFKNYYANLSADDFKIASLEKREIALIPFKEEVMIRHLGFKDATSLKEYLVKNVPMHLYYSSAYYENPQAEEMNLKNWEGADLIFDVDADHIPTNCKNAHDKWSCLNCNLQGLGMAPEECPRCGQKKIEVSAWICEKCLEAAKMEVLKLIDEYLMPDFGISSKEVEICFSGHRGYHVHVYSDDYKKLSSDGRREIADYVRGIGIDLKAHGLKTVNGIVIGPSIGDKGWRGRIARSFYEYLSKASLEELVDVIGKSAELLIKKKDKVLDGMFANAWFVPKGIGLKKISKIVEKAIRQNFCNIDERVTIDTKRLIRYPNSLHGKTGLKVCRLNYADLEKFDPLRDAIVFKSGIMKIYVKDMPKLRIGNYEIGPLRDEVVEVPESMAIYLICKGAAEMRD